LVDFEEGKAQYPVLIEFKEGWTKIVRFYVLKGASKAPSVIQ